MARRNIQRIHKDVVTLSRFFPEVDLDDQYRWVVVHDVPLPAGYSPRKTALLLRIPPDYPVMPPGVGHHCAYLWEGLTYRGSQPCNYYSYNVYCNIGCCDLSAKGWWWYCIHSIPGWNPHTHDLTNIVRVVQQVMST